MDNTEAIKHLEYMKEEWTEKDSIFWTAFEKAIDALKMVDAVQSCLERRAQNESDRG